MKYHFSLKSLAEMAGYRLRHAFDLTIGYGDQDAIGKHIKRFNG